MRHPALTRLSSHALASLQVKLPTLDQRRSILRLTLARHAAEMRMMQIQFGVTGTDGVDPNLLNDRWVRGEVAVCVCVCYPLCTSTPQLHPNSLPEPP